MVARISPEFDIIVASLNTRLGPSGSSESLTTVSAGLNCCCPECESYDSDQDTDEEDVVFRTILGPPIVPHKKGRHERVNPRINFCRKILKHSNGRHR